jgi:hypothetical protein
MKTSALMNSCNQASLVMKSFEKFISPHSSNIIRTKMTRTINISLIDNIDEMNHRMIAEMNHHLTDGSDFIEMNFVIDQMIDFNLIVVPRNALYVTNSIVDQSIIQIRSERTRKSVFQIVFRNSETIIA